MTGAQLEKEAYDYALRLILDCHFSPEPRAWTVHWSISAAEILAEEL